MSKAISCSARGLLALVGLILSAASASAEPGAVFALAYSPDGTRLAVGAYGQVALFDTSTLKPIATFYKIEYAARSLAFTPDGSTLAIGSGMPANSGRITLWNPTTQAASTLATCEDTVESLAFGADGKTLLAGSNDNRVRYFPAFPAAQCKVLDQHNGRVQAVAISSRANYVFASGATDRIVKAWDEKTTDCVVNFDQSEDAVTGIAFLSDGEHLVGSSMDGRLRWWHVYVDKRTKSYAGYPYRTIDAHQDGVFALGISRDGRRLATGGADNRVCVWDANTGGQIRQFSDSTQPIYAVAIGPDGKIVAGAGREGVVRLWDVEANKLLTTMELPALPASPHPTKKPGAAKR